MTRAVQILSAVFLASACAPAPPIAVEPFPTSGSPEIKTCTERPAVALRAEPLYPPQAREDSQPGWVILEYDIANDGTTTNIGVVRSSPPEIFDGVARRALREWRFVPGSPRQKCRIDFRFNPR